MIPLLLALALTQSAPAPEAQPAPVAMPAAPAMTTTPAPAAPAPMPVVTQATLAADGALPTPPSGMGQVVFFRPSAYAGMAVSFTIHDGDTGVCKLGSGSFCVVTVPTGAHTYVVQSEASDKLTLEIDPGETYFVKETMGMGLLLYRPRLSPVTAADFDLKKFHLSTAKVGDIVHSKN